MELLDTDPWYNKYIGFPYKHLGDDPETGIDCFNLCKLVYLQELGIRIPYDTSYFCNITEENWYSQTTEQWMHKAAIIEFGWEKLDTPENFSVILMSLGSTNVSNHCALYLGEGKTLNIMINRTSWIAPYGRYYQQYTTGVYRWIGINN